MLKAIEGFAMNETIHDSINDYEKNSLEFMFNEVVENKSTSSIEELIESYKIKYNKNIRVEEEAALQFAYLYLKNRINKK